MKYEGPEFTLDYFRSEVSKIASGRPWSATLATTETAQSDGAGMRVLMWHAWIDGHRSVYDGDMLAALAWLRSGEVPVGSRCAATEDGAGVVWASGWSVGHRPIPR